MGQAEISELERLANKPELVASILYYNPNRDRKTFYNFVREYGDLNGISIEDRTTTFIEEYVSYWEQLNLWLRSDYNTPFNRLLEIINNALGLILSPIFYPLIGGMSSIENDGDTLTIRTPTYCGSWSLLGSRKTHEYMHAYHAIMVKDFRNRGLIDEIDGYHDVDHTGPPALIKVPSYRTLRRFERKIIYQMIRTICR
ncbi:MAG: hypothetical protein ISS48_01960 [Candidatus Aenigmarchaeota archaeon]|nr:hypothetical protein [Candidatus Aenigmarchaeota archaeon]